MEFSAFIDPPILFFCLGLLVVFVRSDLEIPPQITKFLSLYLLLSIGFKGGVAIAEAGLNVRAAATLGAAILLAFFVPIYSFPLWRLKFDGKNAAALAATYGSVSTVTFITALAFLDYRDLPYSPYMVAALPLMDTPAIIVAVMLAHWKKMNGQQTPLRSVLHDAALNGSVFLLVGSLVIGYLCGERGSHTFNVFIHDMFKGFLSFFLLDLGILAGRRLRDLRKEGLALVALGIIIPLINSVLALLLAKAIGISPGDGFLLMALAASASYIAVPAAMKLCIPEANPGNYITAALGITFPFNILIGLTFYWKIASQFLN